MSYVDAIIDKEKNKIHVVERKKNKRVYQEYPTKYVIAWPSEKGRYYSIFGTRLEKYETTRTKDFQRELAVLSGKTLFESDINPIFRCLADNYKDQDAPELHIGFFDIEVAFDPQRGFSNTSDPFSPITAISTHLSWLDKNITLVIKPNNMTFDQAEQVVAQFQDTILCENEKQMLDYWLNLIDDCDLVSGWNSEGFDIPYIHGRIVQVLGKEHLKRLCLWNKFPRPREYESFGRKTLTYDLVGRIHLDYLQLYRKNTYHEMHSYRLDFVGEYEVGEKKIPYEGSLDMLYNKDFAKFIEYNRQDVMLLVKIDRKLRFMDLANTLAHQNCVLLQTTMGSVALIDNAITNEAHSMNLLVPNRKRSENPEVDQDGNEIKESVSVVGAYVADPVQGLHDWVGAVDINSLYPSCIRALNMSTETIIGQIKSDLTEKLINKRIYQDKLSFADSWHGLFGTLEYNHVVNKDQTPLTIEFENGGNIEMTGEELHEFVWSKGLILSGNGTIFKNDKPGIIPQLLTRWYAERKELQKKAKTVAQLATGIDIPADLEEKVKQILSQQ